VNLRLVASRVYGDNSAENVDGEGGSSADTPNALTGCAKASNALALAVLTDKAQRDFPPVRPVTATVIGIADLDNRLH
jgi:hypothetical protein